MKIKLKILSIILFTLLSCNKSDSKKDSYSTYEKKELKDTLVQNETSEEKPQNDPITFLKMDDVLLNNKKLLLNKNDFEKNYTKIDSTQTDLWECGNPLTFLDKEWMVKTYGKEINGEFEKYDGKITTIYTNGIQFITNNHVVLFDTADAKQNTFTIISRDIILDNTVSIEHFQKLFPNLEKEKTEEPTVFRFRISTEKDSDDAFLFYFKDGKLEHITLWFLLC
jgi:hypothetical protein